MIRLFALLAITPSAQAADWDTSFIYCSGNSTPEIQNDLKSLKSTFSDGKSWEADATREHGELKKLIEITCPAYLANPNGDTALTSFRTDFGRIANEVLQSKQRSDAIIAYFDQKSDAAVKFFGQFGIHFSNTRCGRVFSGLATRISLENAATQAQFAALEKKCPAIASADTDALLAKTRAAAGPKGGQGSGKAVPTGMSNGSSSTITGDTKQDELPTNP